jgi:hypothetical protein
MTPARGAASSSLLAAGLALAALAPCGCVERLLQVRSDPPGAAVYVNGAHAGTTPLEQPFSFYGTVEVALRREGCLSHRELVALRAPWYEAFPLDVISELVVPWNIRDRHELDVRLVPTPADREDEGGREEAPGSGEKDEGGHQGHGAPGAAD